MVFAACAELNLAPEPTFAATHSAEQGAEEAAELTAFEIRARELETGIPVG
jgi:hypothetical protein